MCGKKSEEKKRVKSHVDKKMSSDVSVVEKRSEVTACVAFIKTWANKTQNNCAKHGRPHNHNIVIDI